MTVPCRVDPIDYSPTRVIHGQHPNAIDLCRHDRTDRDVVLKRFEIARLFRIGRTVRLMHRMTHPSTLSCIGFAPPSPDGLGGVVVIEYMRNGSLAQINEWAYASQAPREWNPTAISKAIVGIAAGMAFIHSLALIHRALRSVRASEHILLTRTSKSASPGSAPRGRMDLAR
jgi:serine/threonine protein kinase